MSIAHPKTITDWLSILVLSILLGFLILMIKDAYNLYEKTFPPADATTLSTSKEEWVTYTNTNHGYQISYPPTVTFLRSSQLTQLPAPAGEEDQVVLIEDEINDQLYKIIAGLVIDFTATSSANLKKKYEEIAIPQLIEGRTASRLGLKLEPSDFKISEINFQNQIAIEVVSPLDYAIILHNKNGEVFNVIAQNYTGATTTPKEQLTREIMETFRVLE